MTTYLRWERFGCVMTFNCITRPPRRGPGWAWGILLDASDAP